MKLPWLQFDRDAMQKASALAGLLQLKRRDARGLLTMLWEGALSWGKAEEKPDGRLISPRAMAIIAGWCDWEGDPAVLVTGLVDAGFIELVEGGFRIRGMSRYEGSWNRNHNVRKQPELQLVHPAPSGDRAVTERSPTHQIQTQTHKKQKKKSAGDAPATPDPAFRELTDGVVTAYKASVGAKYAFEAKDGVALAHLRGLGIPDKTILGVWRHALQSQEFPRVRDIIGLRQHWHHLLDGALNRRPSSPSVPGMLAIDRPRGA